MTRRRRTKAQIAEAIFLKLNYEKECSLSSFRKLGLNKTSTHDFISIINCVSQHLTGTNLIEITKVEETTIIRLNNGSSTIENKNTTIIHTDYQKSDIVQAIENAISKLAFRLQTGELATQKRVTPEKLEEAAIITEGYEDYLIKDETFSQLVKQKNKEELGSVFAELKKSRAKVEGE